MSIALHLGKGQEDKSKEQEERRRHHSLRVKIFRSTLQPSYPMPWQAGRNLLASCQNIDVGEIHMRDHDSGKSNNNGSILIFHTYSLINPCNRHTT